ncbi:MAG: hypothetical protein ACU0A9_15965 [Alterinioella nitratireducens]|uniref:hypothetical protein n=1 Tax=Alterinioella nitratireducens TaxID=2735915 RepID=UPI0040582F04
MGIESIGEIGGKHSDYRLDMAFRLAEVWLFEALGDPPRGVDVVLMSHDHDLGAYSTVAVQWDEAYCDGEPSQFIARAQDALAVFQGAVEWADLNPEHFSGDGEDG